MQDLPPRPYDICCSDDDRQEGQANLVQSGDHQRSHKNKGRENDTEDSDIQTPGKEKKCLFTF